MTRDLFEKPDPAPPEPAGPSRMMWAGVAAACVLGVGLGFWARPAEPVETVSPAPHSKSNLPRPVLQIVVDNTPAPIGRPLEVLSTEPAAPLSAPARFSTLSPATAAPRRAASGLVRVDAPVAVDPAPPVPSAPKPKAKPKAIAVEPEPRLAKARVVEARATQAERARAIKLAQARKAETVRAMKLAKAETRRAKKALKIATAAKAASALKPVKVAAVRPEKKKAAAKPATARGSGPLRVARADVCASHDPGEAIVCADRRLGARDRQLQAAYRTAEAAGVPASALRRQQTRWLQARAAAAREAPWAVEDVYVARISELKDQTRDARED